MTREQTIENSSKRIEKYINVIRNPIELENLKLNHYESIISLTHLIEREAGLLRELIIKKQSDNIKIGDV